MGVSGRATQAMNAALDDPCCLCLGDCRHHSMGHQDEWEAEKGSLAWLVQQLPPWPTEFDVLLRRGTIR